LSIPITILWQKVTPIIPILLLKSIANTNTNAFVTILFAVLTFSNIHFFSGKWQSNHCRAVSTLDTRLTVLAFTLSVTVMSLLTDLLVHLMTKVLVSNTAKKYLQMYRRYPYRYCIRTRVIKYRHV